MYDVYIHTVLFIPTQWGDGSLYRAVKYSEMPLDVSQLSYPPVDMVRLNRANLPGNPLFYCSGDPRTPFFELNIQAGDTVVLSKWRIANEILCIPLGYSEQIFAQLCSARKCPHIIPPEKRHPNELKKPNSYIIDFFSEIFTCPEENRYTLTAVIAEKFLMKQLSCGIVYPTIAMRANAENFAFTPHLVNESLFLLSAKWYRVDNVDNKSFSYTVTPLKCADNFFNGKINWREVSQEDNRYLN